MSHKNHIDKDIYNVVKCIDKWATVPCSGGCDVKIDDTLNLD